MKIIVAVIFIAVLVMTTNGEEKYSSEQETGNLSQVVQTVLDDPIFQALSHNEQLLILEAMYEIVLKHMDDAK